MVRKAALIALALMAAPAYGQSSTTKCSTDYFGNITCDTTQNQGVNWGLLGQQQNQGQVLQSGANSVPNYAEQQLKRREMELRERELRLREQAADKAEAAPPAAIPPPVGIYEKYGMSAAQQDFMANVLNFCRSGAPITDITEKNRSLTGAVCYAYDQGRIAEIVGDKR